MKKYLLSLFILCGIIGKSQVYKDPGYLSGFYASTTNNPFLFWIQDDGTIYLKNSSGYVNKVKNIGGLDPNYGNLNIGPIKLLRVVDNKLLINDGTYLKRRFLEGTLDVSFGNNGMINWALGPFGQQYIFINEDNSFFILRNSKIEKYTANGILEYDFPLGVDIAALNNITKSKNNYFYISYSFNSLSMVKKLDSQGNLVTSFGNNGVIILPYPMLLAVNNIEELSFTRKDGSTYFVYKYTDNGILDNNFGVSGIAQFPQQFDYEYLGVSNFDSIGNIIVILNRMRISDLHGMVPNGNTLVRITPSGQLDNSFNNGSAMFYDGYNTSRIGGLKFINDNEFLCSNSSNGLNISHGFIKYKRTSSSLSVDEISKKTNDLSFDNPFNNEVRFHLKEKIKSVEIYDESGRLALSGNTSKLNTSLLAKGIYFIKITTESNKIISKKGIKN
ncbi:T9SS type A sorting domain-containing protein [Chryseobacterium sp. W4I1]|uniref:T9SS type A sorting domain-containing protein n=1 Tax=Chryseobacterium sp. W4I1 TaxID=3042293 RepID=UPI0027893FF9|nr:T9SS type A sorting domain-containing protein [Chryseobacterium sp. W4I1]MDQ0780898.1 hypothetical protein [Chryseobacterium sp. W4I1]